MNTLPIIYQHKAASKALILAMIICFVLLVLLVAAYLSLAPKYRSQLSLVLPGDGAQSQVVLEELGQVNASSPSSYGKQHNPRANYKAILLSDALRQKVAYELGKDSLSKPKVTLLQQTSIMTISVEGFSGEDAEQIGWAYYRALQSELDRLRRDESERRDLGIESVLEGYRQELLGSRAAIVDFQQRSLLVSSQQLDQSVLALSQLQDKMTYVNSELAAKKRYIGQLATQLGISSSLAAHALTLQSDSKFSSYLEQLHLTAGQLSQFESQWGKRHPKVLAEQHRFTLIQTQLHERSAELVGVYSAEVLKGMNLTAGMHLSALFSDLLQASAEVESLSGEYDTMTLAENRLKDRLKVLSREGAELERLEREHQRAETIYNSAAARLEASKADIFASYPVAQLLSPPSIPLKAHSPSPVLAIAALIVGILFIATSGVVIWQRQRIIAVLLKKRA